jgi:hypothetical protein
MLNTNHKNKHNTIEKNKKIKDVTRYKRIP